MSRGAALGRIERRVAEQEIAEAVEHAIVHLERHGWTVDTEGRARQEAFERYYRTQLVRFDDAEEVLRQAADWWAPRIGVSADEYIAAVRQHMEVECAACAECEGCRPWGARPVPDGRACGS